MEDEKINRAYLETLSFPDLVKLADEYGVDVPEDLDRRFLLCELLELAQENMHDRENSMVISTDESVGQSTNLPKGYNETQISCVLCNPVWAFVFWDISDTEMNTLKALPDFSIILRVCVLNSETELTPQEVFEISIPNGATEQYVLIPSGKRFIRIELVSACGSSREVLAFSPVVSIPQSSEFVENFQPGVENNFPPIIKHSGIEKILLEQYKNYRHSFS
ncbi:MAG: DUF4912 domain-containing protein [Treponema sp.]|nr:DUF4912 domain-containing protein [Treponema sp.]